MTQFHTSRSGFTLIELSIVLVIIGLIVGGVLVGQDLIKAAAVRAQISQIEKYNTAVSTFSIKYNALPGDIATGPAGTFGFLAGSGSPGQGDGNGLLDGCSGATAYTGVDCGEAGVFWVHLSQANLIDGNFNTALYTTGPNNPPSTNFPLYLPSAKLGGGNYILAYEYNGVNYFELTGISNLWSAGNYSALAALTVSQAYNIDKKIDDGIPTSGAVQAFYPAAGSLGITQDSNGASDSATTCYNSSTNTYSMSVNNGNNLNCAIAFRMQGAGR